MKANGLKQMGCELRDDGWYIGDRYLGKTATEARKELAGKKKDRIDKI